MTYEAIIGDHQAMVDPSSEGYCATVVVIWRFPQPWTREGRV
jgi:hypothetical protein